MRSVRVVNARMGAELGDRVRVADTWWARLRGQLGRPAPARGEGLVLSPCRSVHMYGMPYPLDVAFLDREGRVVASYRPLAPGRRSRWHRAAACAVELPAGTLDATGTANGDPIVLEGSV
ncbi:MAG TPA: DUF192 domain-containing protein [Gemmatimonadales bacterium]|nr:DUF192 domain-containing protein [Gemmatimonadales bacterium]